LSEFVSGVGRENLRARSIEELLLRVIAEWNCEYGKLYPQLRAFARYLKESLQLPLPDIWVRWLCGSSNLII
jgi:hypothetical protein